MATMTHFVVGDKPAVLVAIHSEQTPSTQEWEAYLAAFEAIPGVAGNGSLDQVVAVVAITDGGAPNHMQRAQINRLLHARDLKTAVVSRSPTTRTVIAALSLFNNALKAFSPAAFRDALDYVQAPTEMRQAIEAASRDNPASKTLKQLSL